MTRERAFVTRKNMSTPTSTGNRAPGAVVIGGSIAGLLTARVLSDHFDGVTIVERDQLADAPAHRAGAPQAAHQHVLLLRGLQVVERLFPGMREELLALGAPLVDMASEMAWLTPAGWGVRFASELKMVTCSRELLEWALRRRLLALKNVRTIQATDVTGLVQERAIAGVRLRARHSATGERSEPAQLVVDASGRHSKAPEWLEALGFARPTEEVVNGFLGYASRVYRVPDADRFAWRGAYVQPAPPAHTRGGVIFPLEGQRWHVTLAGVGGDYPPTDEAGFLAFARSLRSSILYDAIRGAEPLTPIAGYRATENCRRRYEQMRRLPDGLVVLGDAACSFNPVYAQGMTTAALAAETLGTLLAQQPRRTGVLELTGFSRRFQRALAQVHAAPWRLATSEDLRLPQTTGARPHALTRVLHGYMDRVIRLTTERPDVRLTFLRSMHMLEGPSALFAPRVVWAAFRSVSTPFPSELDSCTPSI